MAQGSPEGGGSHAARHEESGWPESRAHRTAVSILTENTPPFAGLFTAMFFYLKFKFKQAACVSSVTLTLFRGRIREEGFIVLEG